MSGDPLDALTDSHRVIWVGDFGRQVILVEEYGLILADADLTRAEVAKVAQELLATP